MLVELLEGGIGGDLVGQSTAGGELEIDRVGKGEVRVDSYGVEEAGDVVWIAAVVDEAAATGGHLTAELGGMNLGEVVAASGLAVRALVALIVYGQLAEEVDAECLVRGSPRYKWGGNMSCQGKRGSRPTGRHDMVDSSSNHSSLSWSGCSRRSSSVCSPLGFPLQSLGCHCTHFNWCVW